MDIAAMASSVSQLDQASLASQVGLKVLSMAKDQATQQGQDFVQMVQKSLDPNLGQRLDIKV